MAMMPDYFDALLKSIITHLSLTVLWPGTLEDTYRIFGNVVPSCVVPSCARYSYDLHTRDP